MKFRSLLLPATFALAMIPMAATQQSATSGEGSQANNPAAQQQNTFRQVEGCLAYNGVSYVLAVVSNGPKQYRVVGGDVEGLRGKVGHTVEIVGPTGQNSPQAMVENWDQRQATTGVGWYTITADQVRDITSNCSYPGFEQPPSRVHMN